MEQKYYSSPKINCPYCNCREHRNGKKTYYHQVITPVLVSPVKKQVINLAPEFIKKQDGRRKQDCENAAVKRWLLSNPVEREKAQITLLGFENLIRDRKFENIRFKILKSTNYVNSHQAFVGNE